MLWTVFAILIVLWRFHFGGNFIHILLVLALLLAAVNLLPGRSTA
jgi:hypothetical protein